MTTMPELKSCPFCGGKAALFVDGGVRVLCVKCRARTRELKDGIIGETGKMPMVFEWIITEPTGRKTTVIAQTRRAAIDKFVRDSGIPRHVVEDDCKIVRGCKV